MLTIGGTPAGTAASGKLRKHTIRKSGTTLAELIRRPELTYDAIRLY